MTLALAPDLVLPDDFATQGVAIIGVRGSGKSNTEVRYAELLHSAGIPFVAVDPKGDWWGIRMEGTGPGLPVPVFGGLYGDFPLEPGAGAQIADLLVDENLSAVLDVSRLSKTAGLPRFLTDFCDRLMDRHQREPHVRTVILEEAHRYIPQVVNRSTARLKEAAAALLLEGRAFGVGCWACTQRPARLHNDVLEEVDTAVIHRIGVTATADLKRVRDWVKHEDLGAEVSESLTKLANGEAWILSPTALGVVQRVQVDRRTTFDSGATPLTGVAKRELGTMATIDAAAITAALAESIERAEADDPKHLKARIRELEQQLAALERDRDVEPVVQLVPVVSERVVELLGRVPLLQVDLAGVASELGVIARAIEEELAATAAAAPAPRSPVVPRPPAEREPAKPRPERAPRIPSESSAETLGGAPGRILAVLAQFPQGRTRRQVAALAGLAARKSTIRNALSTLRTRGLIEEHGDQLVLTRAGATAAGGVAPLPTGPELVEHWRNEIGGGAPRRIFDVLIDRYPAELSRSDITALTGDDGSTLRNALSKLRSLDLIAGDVRASDDLMEAIQ